LQCLSVNPHQLFKGPVDFSHPLFSRITHLTSSPGDLMAGRVGPALRKYHSLYIFHSPSPCLIPPSTARCNTAYCSRCLLSYSKINQSL
jgi:hypothetical protein